MIKNQVGALFCEKQHYETPIADVSRFMADDVVTASGVGQMTWDNSNWGETWEESRDNTFGG